MQGGYGLEQVLYAQFERSVLSTVVMDLSARPAASSLVGHLIGWLAVVVTACGPGDDYHSGASFDYDESERWTRVGYERGMRFRKGER